MVEFVSANPTGPLHLGHARQAALGDALANVLAAQGWQVTREFYYNDAGVQIDNLARSVQARAKELQGQAGRVSGRRLSRRVHRRHRARFPRQGDGDRARRHAGAGKRRHRRSGHDPPLRGRLPAPRTGHGPRSARRALRQLLPRVLAVRRRQGRHATVQALVDSGMTYEQEGALWLRTTAFADIGDDKDRVMRKSDGSYTYFVPDVAYHVDQVPARLQQGHQHPGHRPPRHDGARPRRRAGCREVAGRGRAAGLSRTTCCTRCCGSRRAARK